MQRFAEATPPYRRDLLVVRVELAGSIAARCCEQGFSTVSAGASPLRSGGTLSWLLNDHLGETAYTVSGTAETGEVRYKAFGVTCHTMVY